MSNKPSRPPVQPVNEPILCSPYEEPHQHWMYRQDKTPSVVPGRRPASYYYRVARMGTGQISLFGEEEREDLPFINAMRADVKRWRESGYEGATEVTKQLLAHWWRSDRTRRLFFCQLEAAETIIFLNEIRINRKYLRFNPQADDDAIKEHTTDWPAGGLLPPLTRLGIKMATGSGKTVVMSMLIAWVFCNRGQVSTDERFPDAVLAVCPNLTIKERLQVLRPDHPKNYYEQFDLVPQRMRPLLQRGKVAVTNWHLFQPESPHAEGGRTYDVVNKGPEGPDAFARRVLGDLYERAQRGGLMVLNDEAHHAWRAAPLLGAPPEDQEATIWVNGLDTLNTAVGVRFCVDLSATPFYIGGSGYTEGQPFPWLVSDFGLVDAIESGIVKIPRLPVSDSTGRPEPKYFRLWHTITDKIPDGRKKRGKPAPEEVYREAEGALTTLASQWKERFDYFQNADRGQERVPPVMIVVCDNTDLAEVIYNHISGESEELVTVETRGGNTKEEAHTVYGRSHVLDEFSNRADFQPTIRIDSDMLAKAESGDPAVSREDAAERLRRIVSTVGQAGQPGEHVRCVVSVAMLNEGWDANNVTHILGLRAFGSQLLCEQVVGRGLRRMNYNADENGMLAAEYVDIYGVPFSLIPFRGRKTDQKAPEDKPKNHVCALPERGQYEITFPHVTGYASALKHNLVTADVDKMEPLDLRPENEPDATFVQPQVLLEGSPHASGVGERVIHDRTAFYAAHHPQTIEYEITLQVVTRLAQGDGGGDPTLRGQSRHQLFPQVLRLARAYLRDKVNLRGRKRQELGLQQYTTRVVERLMAAIVPDDMHGENPLLPILDRYTPRGSTADVDFKTTRPCYPITHSHINQMPTDTATWENTAAFQFERAVDAGWVRAYARNDGLGMAIPYEYMGIRHRYEPDFLVKLILDEADRERDVTLIVEIKGYETDQDRAKHQAAKRWVQAVNNWGRMGQWRFHVGRDPQTLYDEIDGIRAHLLSIHPPQMTTRTAEPPETTARRELPTAWRDSIEIAPESEAFLRRCFRAGLPLPEVGYESNDRRRFMAELAWETLRTAVFLPGQDTARRHFQEGGWTPFDLTDGEAAIAHLRTQQEQQDA